MEDSKISNGEMLPEKLKGYEMSLYKREESIDKKIVGGKLLMWSASKEFTFVQNAPRGARSVEIGRTAHARIVRLVNGHYSVRFRFGAKEREIGYQLLAEIRELNKMAQADEEKEAEKRKRQQEEEEKKQEKKTTTKKGGR